MFKPKSIRNKILSIIAVLLVVNAVILAATATTVVVREPKTFSASMYDLQYDESKLAITNLGDLSYDSSGNLDKINLTIENKDPSIAYSGLLEVSVSGQSFQIPVPSTAPGATVKIPIDLSPNLTLDSPIGISATVYVLGIAQPSPTSSPAPTSTPSPATSTPSPTNNPTPTSNPTNAPTITPQPPTPNPTSTPTASPTPVPIPSGVDFAAIKASSIADSQIDGNIGTEWNDAKHYTNIPIDPQGTAEIWTKNDGVNLYIAIKFTADSNNPWLAMELGSASIHSTGADLAIFGDDRLSANGYSDASFASASSVKADSIQNGVGAMTITAGNVVSIELKKPLNSGDTAGKDIAWTAGNTYTMVIAWDSNGGGSSGGTIDHTGGTTPTARSIYIGT